MTQCIHVIPSMTHRMTWYASMLQAIHERGAGGLDSDQELVYGTQRVIAQGMGDSTHVIQ